MSPPEFDAKTGQHDEWQRQELALQAERRAAVTADIQPDDELAEYRLIDRALRAQHDEPPEHFAAQTAAFVHSASPAVVGDRLESWLQRALLAALIVTAVVTLFLMGGRALAGLASVRGAEWIYTVATCVALSLGMQHLAQRRMKKLGSRRSRA